MALAHPQPIARSASDLLIPPSRRTLSRALTFPDGLPGRDSRLGQAPLSAARAPGASPPARGLARSGPTGSRPSSSCVGGSFERRRTGGETGKPRCIGLLAPERSLSSRIRSSNTTGRVFTPWALLEMGAGAKETRWGRDPVSRRKSQRTLLDASKTLRTWGKQLRRFRVRQPPVRIETRVDLRDAAVNGVRS